MRKLSHIQFKTGKERLPEILDTIRHGRCYGPDISSPAANFFGGLFYGMGGMAEKSLKMLDSNFNVDDKCKACRICERICPQANIRITSNKPVWQHNCGQCNACIQWCPQQAIHIRNETCRFRNPNVKAEDLLLR